MSDLDPFDIRGQEQADEERKASERLAEANDEGDFRWLMADPRGRRIARRWLSQAGVWRVSYDRDPTVTAFNEGQRNMGLWILDRAARWTPHQLVLLLGNEDD
jgi:hypothetical protein